MSTCIETTEGVAAFNCVQIERLSHGSQSLRRVTSNRKLNDTLVDVLFHIKFAVIGDKRVHEETNCILHMPLALDLVLGNGSNRLE